MPSIYDSNINYEDKINESLHGQKVRNMGVLLINANKEKNFQFDYLLYVPSKPQDLLVIDCVNEYEDPMNDGEVENKKAVEEVYRSIFGKYEGNDNIERGLKEEEYKKTKNRMFYRLYEGLCCIKDKTELLKSLDIPIIVPLIPGKVEDGKNSELDKEVISDVAPQIKAMIEDAKGILEEKRNIKMKDKVFVIGHSKSYVFAKNFVAYYPELSEILFGGGDEITTIRIGENWFKYCRR